MGDQHGGAFATGKEWGEPGLHASTGQAVQRGKRLIEQEDGLPGEPGPGEGDPLAHASTQLGRLRVLEATESEPFEHRQCLLPGHLPAPALVSKGQGGVVERAEPGEEAVLLGHVGTPGQPIVRSRTPANRDRPGGWPVEAGDQSEEGRLPAA